MRTLSRLQSVRVRTEIGPWGEACAVSRMTCAAAKTRTEGCGSKTGMTGVAGAWLQTLILMLLFSTTRGASTVCMNDGAFDRGNMFSLPLKECQELQDRSTCAQNRVNGRMPRGENWAWVTCEALNRICNPRSQVAVKIERTVPHGRTAGHRRSFLLTFDFAIRARSTGAGCRAVAKTSTDSVVEVCDGD